MIGPDWADSRDAAGRRRLDNPADFVRLELESALSRGVKVIVVLVRGASLPDVHQLPPSLEGLGRCPTIAVRPFPTADVDLERLVQVIVGAAPTLTRWRPAYPRLTVASALVLPISLGAGFVTLQSELGGKPTPVPFPLLAATALVIFCVEYGCLFYAAFTAVRLARSGWVIALFASLGYALVVFGLVGPIKRARPVAPASIVPPAWRSVGVQR